MKHIHIKQKLEAIGVSLDSISMGNFDYIGEFTAKRDRKPDDPLYHKVGSFYRANYERGIMIYYLIRQFNLSSFLEIGFGRGYSTFCAARAFHDAGTNGKITTIDPNLDENYLKALQTVFPKDWFSYITFVKDLSKNALPKIEEKFDLVYIDGDHSYAGTKIDWDLTKNMFKSHLLFDDYHLPEKEDKGTIQCSLLIDEVDWKKENCEEPELLILDRRLFFDDRRFTDEQINYGQVLLTKKGVSVRDDW